MASKNFSEVTFVGGDGVDDSCGVSWSNEVLFKLNKCELGSLQVEFVLPARGPP